MLLRDPLFTALAVSTLAFGIGANTTVFSLVRASIIQPLPYPAPHRLVQVWSNYGNGNTNSPISHPDVIQIRNQNDVLTGVGFYKSGIGMTLTDAGTAGYIEDVPVSPSLFSVLGVPPLMGRQFSEDEGEPGKDHVVIVSYKFWKEHLGSAPSTVGKQISLDNQSYTIVGVMPPDFSFPSRFFDIWTPASIAFQDAESRTLLDNFVIGRLKQGASLREAQAHLDGLAANLGKQYNDDQGLQFKVVSLQEQTAGPVETALLSLFGAVGIVLLIACANVTGLVLARNAKRQREIAVRMALGAGRARLVRQLLTEGCLLVFLGGTFGLAIAFVGVRIVRGVAPPSIPALDRVGIDGMVLTFTLIVSILSGIAFGLVPAFRGTKAELNDSLKEGGLASQAGFRMSGSHRLQSMLVIGQVALAVILMVGAGLLVRSLSRMLSVELGFNPRNVLAVRLSEMSTLGLGQSARKLFYQRVLEETRALPGVQSVTLVSDLPLGGLRLATSMNVEGAPQVDLRHGANVQLQEVTVGYFEAMEIPITAGRGFTNQDNDTSSAVAIVNQSAARKYWPGQNPLGRRIDLGGGLWCQVIGVAGDARDIRLETAPGPEVYRPLLQQHDLESALLLRTKVEPQALSNAVIDRIWSVYKGQRIVGVMTMDDLIAKSVIGPRFHASLLGLFAALALFLASVGIYSTTAYSVTQRTREIGIRMALGAQGSDVLKMLLGEALALVFAGLAIGLFGAFGLTRFVANLLFGVTATDPLTFAIVAILLTSIALAASYIPTRRALKVDPVLALRYE